MQIINSPQISDIENNSCSSTAYHVACAKIFTRGSGYKLGGIVSLYLMILSATSSMASSPQGNNQDCLARIDQGGIFTSSYHIPFIIHFRNYVNGSAPGLTNGILQMAPMDFKRVYFVEMKFQDLAACKNQVKSFINVYFQKKIEPFQLRFNQLMAEAKATNPFPNYQPDTYLEFVKKNLKSQACHWNTSDMFKKAYYQEHVDYIKSLNDQAKKSGEFAKLDIKTSNDPNAVNVRDLEKFKLDNFGGFLRS